MEFSQTGWTRVRTPTGRYEYQFQGEGPAVRQGRYLDARDFNFLVMDEEGLLYRVPVRVSAEALAGLQSAEKAQDVAGAQLRAGLDRYRPQQGAPYEDLDSIFALDAPRAEELARGGS
jgi:hypothetical protein